MCKWKCKCKLIEKEKQQQQLATKVKTNWNWNALNQLYIGIPNCNNNNIHTTFLDWHVNCKLSQCKMSNAEDSELDPQIQVRLQPKPKLKCTCACTPRSALCRRTYSLTRFGARPWQAHNTVTTTRLATTICSADVALARRCCVIVYVLVFVCQAVHSLCVSDTLFLSFAHTKSALVLISLTVDNACVCVCAGRWRWFYSIMFYRFIYFVFSFALLHACAFLRLAELCNENQFS